MSFERPVLWVFDQNFNQLGVITTIETLQWQRVYTHKGSFTLTIPLGNKFNEDLYNLIKIGHYLYKPDTDETRYISAMRIDKDAENVQTLTVTGYSLSYYLSYRVAQKIEFENTHIVDVINNIINTNFINPTNQNRRIPNLQAFNLAQMRTNVGNILINTYEENKNVYEYITSLLTYYEIGLDLYADVRNKRIIWNIYKGIKTNARFSPTYQNILSQDYYFSENKFKNTAIMGFEIATGIGDPIQLTKIVGDQNTGLNRREIYANSDANAEITVTEQGAILLAQHQKLTTFDSVINVKNQQFIYCKDWDLGDIVTLKNDIWNLKTQTHITEITEHYDSTGKNIAVVFGSTIPTIADRINSLEVK